MSISSSTTRWSGIAALSIGMPMTATRPPLRTNDAHWPSAAGSPEHSSATSAPCVDLDWVDGREVDRLEPERGGLLQPRAAADDDHATGAGRGRELGDEQPHDARPDDDDGVARVSGRRA